MNVGFFIRTVSRVNRIRARRAGGRTFMVRWFPVLGILLIVAGCGEPAGRRVVPVTPTTTRAADGDDAAARAVTRPPRAIATH
jgi:hypothetical protein